jgi:hypothetical protein
MYMGLHVKYLLFFSRNPRNIKFHENSSSGSRVDPCGQTDGLTDMARLIVAFGNFANAPKNGMGHGDRSSVSFTSPSDIRRNIKGTDDITELK